MNHEITCTCSLIPPTMPTCRDEHLLPCPLAWVAWLLALKLSTDG